jgi:hypothetical protein
MNAPKKLGGLLYILFLFAVLSSSVFGESVYDVTGILEEIEEMLVDADVRYSATIKILREQQETEYAMTIWMKGRDFVSRVERPILDKGTIYLNTQGNAWVYYPSIDKTVKSTNKQRILGSDFSVTDIASVNLLTDYDCRIIDLNPDEFSMLPYFNPEELADCQEKGLVIEAVAKEGKTMDYPKVRCFINAKRQLIREEFYTLSGRMLGILTYEDYGDLGGKPKPKRMVMRTTLHDHRYTVLTYEKADYSLGIPQVYFAENYMPRLSRM